MIKAVVFDMDGLLFDTERLWIMSALYASEQMGHGVEESFLHTLLGATCEDSRKRYFETYGEDFPYEEHCKVAHACREKVMEESGIPVKPGVYELLRYLKKKDYIVGLATSTARNTALQHLNRAKIADYFKELICGDEIKNGKPAPDIYLEACRKLDVLPAHAMALEDSYNGIRAAKAAGMLPVMIPDILQPTPEIETLLYTKYNQLDEVIPLLEKMR